MGAAITVDTDRMLVKGELGDEALDKYSGAMENTVILGMPLSTSTRSIVVCSSALAAT